MKVLVGCPVSAREWILPTWKEHTDAALEGFDFSYVFVNSVMDRESHALCSKYGTVVPTVENKRADNRHWEAARVHKMTTLRNTLLTYVRGAKPDIFFSLDSDILLHPDAFKMGFQLLEDTQYAWAVGLKCFMTPDSTMFPSNAMRAGTHYDRIRVSKPVEVDIIMAAKIMTPLAYNVDYSFENFGEDGGWSKNVKNAGGKLMWDGRITNKHIMQPEDLNKYDERAGW